MNNNEAVSIELKKVLTKLFEIEELTKKFYLAGGTNLALKYNHRISTDIDLFINYNENINFEDKIVPILEQKFKNRLQLIALNKNTLRTTIDTIKVDFLSWSSIKQQLKPFEIIENTNWILAADIDVAAMKLNAIINRGTKKDFFDIAFLLQKFTIEELINAYKIKYNIQSDTEILKYLLDFHEADLETNRTIQTLNFKPTDWDSIKQNIKHNISNYIKQKSFTI